MEARNNMHMASVFAGIGFGNAGVHLWYVYVVNSNWHIIKLVFNSKDPVLFGYILGGMGLKIVTVQGVPNKGTPL